MTTITHGEYRIVTTRKELYDLVWSIPIRTLAKYMGYSDKGLAKICKRNDIPRPSRGYWRKVEKGFPVEKTSLPNGRSVIQLDRSYRFDETLDAERQDTEKIIQSNSTDTVAIVRTLRSAHPLVLKAREALEREDHDNNDAIFGKEHLDVCVTNPHIHRALLIMNALIKALEDNGHSVVVEGGETKAIILDVEIQFRLIEVYDPVWKDEVVPDWRPDSYKSKHNGYNYEYHPTGKLKVEIVGVRWGWDWGYELRKNWMDTQTRKLEDQLAGVIKGLVACAIAKRKTLNEQYERERIREEEQSLEKTRSMLIQEEKRKIDLLMKVIDLWGLSNKVKAFVSRAEQEIKNGNIPAFVEGDPTQWVQWAKQYADHLDPLADSPKSIFNLL